MRNKKRQGSLANSPPIQLPKEYVLYYKSPNHHAKVSTKNWNKPGMRTKNSRQKQTHNPTVSTLLRLLPPRL